MSQPIPYVIEAYKALSTDEQGALKDVGGYVLGELKDGRRRSGMVLSRSGAVLDTDNVPPGGKDEFVRRVAALGLCCCVYSTAKHCPEAPRLRVVFPFSEDLPAEQYPPVARLLCQCIQPEMTWFDPTTDEVGRMMYYASHCQDVAPVWHEHEGQGLLDAAKWLAQALPNWQDSSTWPRFPREQKLFDGALKKAQQQDPESKTGIVGAFCRVYDVPTAMDKFLPGVYEATATEGRYTFTGGSTWGGAVLYDGGKFLYSHHATDPCGGKLVNAWDMVRLHKFGDLDDEAKEGAMGNRLPSYAAMCDLAKQDEAVADLMARERAASAAADFQGVIDEAATVPLLVPMTDVEPKEASYLISPYLPRGMLAIMGGVSGSGKTYLALSWAAAVSNGQRLPFQAWNSPAPPRGYVYYFTQENAPNTIIRPRLDLLSADLSRILIQTSNGITYDRLTLNDPRLEIAAKQYPPTLIIFDPIQSYLGGGVDMNKAERVRPVLDWLGDYAKRHECTIVLVSHMSKPGKGESSALDRLLGSSDFRNAARSIIVVGRDPEDRETRVFAHGKNSIGEPGESQKYHISGAGVTYNGPCDLTADDIIKQSAAARNKPAVTLTNAMQLLQNLMEPDGYASLEDVEAMKAGAGISMATLYRAKDELAIKSISIGQPPNRKNWWLRYDVDEEKFKQDKGSL